jgi:hypothetical protein
MENEWDFKDNFSRFFYDIEFFGIVSYAFHYVSHYSVFQSGVCG